MKRNLLALIWLTGEEAGSKAQAVPPTQNLLGKSMLQLAIEAAKSLRPESILVVSGAPKGPSDGSFLPPVVQWLQRKNIVGILQAVDSARDSLVKNSTKDLVVLDARLAVISPPTLRSFLSAHRRQKNSLTVAAGPEVLPLFIARTRDLLAALDRRGRRKRDRDGVPGLIRTITQGGKKTSTFPVRKAGESLVVRKPEDVSRAIVFLRARKLKELESRGVVALDPATTWVGLDVRVGRGTIIYPSAVIEGSTTIGEQCRIYPFVHLIDTHLGDRVKVLSSTMIERSRVEDDAQVGPFTHFRPNTTVGPKAKVGNFVEMKNTVFGERSKAGHLSYLGDTVVKEGVNIGAGTITCNYDGFKKSQTVIERGAFIGSGTELIAPVRIGRRAYVGAGSVITKDVSPESLAVARGRQVEKRGWVLRKRTK